jgi:multicomponent Na+:H+ antiporter subunit C
MEAILIANYNYWIYIVIMMIGLYAMLAKNNLVKKVIGMGIFQTGIIVFYVSAGAKSGATIPILEHHGRAAVEVQHYVNPLPHVLMLTAIVVSVGTLGVALALALRIFNRYRTLEEDEILEQIRD